jgi:hypothetical protein
MAQRVQVLLVCDLHDGDTPGTETVTFGLDGTSYEIDVCEQHAGELRDSFARFVGAGRRASRAGTGARRGRRGPSSYSGVDPAAVRAWAKSKGIKLNQRGRIPAGVIEQFRADGH